MRRSLKNHPVVRVLSSLQLTVALLAALMVLIVVGTVTQVQLGIFLAQKRFFEAWFIWVPLGGFDVPVFPAGFSVGALLLANLVAAHATRFQWKAKKVGIHLIHAGLILLLVGQFFTAIIAVESQLVFEEGESVNFSQSLTEFELALIDVTEADRDDVYSIPRALFGRPGPFEVPGTPFTVRVAQFFPNVEIVEGDIRPLPLDTREDAVNHPTAIFDLEAGGESLGRFVGSAGLLGARTFEHAGRRWTLEMRRKRHYYPYALRLLDFKHDRYPGTDIPKNFSSEVRLFHPGTGEDREILIYMNHPLRYDGKAFFQASFGKDDTLSVLQVVDNPGWTIPYLACVLVSAGLLWQFWLGLSAWLKRRPA